MGERGMAAGTQSEYFSLYATTSVAIKQVCPTCQVGGPAVSVVRVCVCVCVCVCVHGRARSTLHECWLTFPVRCTQSEAGGWLPEFVNYTAAGGYPVDFISTHGYPNQVGNGMEVDGMAMLVSAARAQVCGVCCSGDLNHANGWGVCRCVCAHGCRRTRLAWAYRWCTQSITPGCTRSLWEIMTTHSRPPSLSTRFHHCSHTTFVCMRMVHCWPRAGCSRQ